MVYFILASNCFYEDARSRGVTIAFKVLLESAKQILTGIGQTTCSLVVMSYYKLTAIVIDVASQKKCENIGIIGTIWPFSSHI